MLIVIKISNIWSSAVKSWKDTSDKYLELNSYMVLREGKCYVFHKFQPCMELNCLMVLRVNSKYLIRYQPYMELNS